MHVCGKRNPAHVRTQAKWYRQGLLDPKVGRVLLVEAAVFVTLAVAASLVFFAPDCPELWWYVCGVLPTDRVRVGMQCEKAVLSPNLKAVVCDRVRTLPYFLCCSNTLYRTR